MLFTELSFIVSFSDERRLLLIICLWPTPYSSLVTRLSHFCRKGKTETHAWYGHRSSQGSLFQLKYLAEVSHNLQETLNNPNRPISDNYETNLAFRNVYPCNTCPQLAPFSYHFDSFKTTGTGPSLGIQEYDPAKAIQMAVLTTRLTIRQE